MLNRDLRTFLILELYKKGYRIRRIQHILQISRSTILKAICSQSSDSLQQPKVLMIDNTHVVGTIDPTIRRR